MVFLPQFPKEQLLTQLSNGFVLLVLGMGTVFIFLILLVFLTKGLSAFVMKLESKRPAVATGKPAAAVAATASEADIAAAVAAAWAKANE
ncbi:MAG TPA: OadG family protein [Sphaerochaeta sp.]|jgi:oxaloacetate decarboxylase gamma subunit|nr:MAG: sodium pump decarboxylase subunit gamma [Sphaerochaeta sp.]HOE90141.1 OadG family protein [Sphaerochaeta sp.]HOR80913.1 OadG family protein [Sphaerochaeta sp.]HPB41713.1 OadG family protein [Sphaerochaeta sp.]HPK64839.1 OadG family protein [Sphaerochaeta sp.]